MHCFAGQCTDIEWLVTRGLFRISSCHTCIMISQLWLALAFQHVLFGFHCWSFDHLITHHLPCVENLRWLSFYLFHPMCGQVYPEIYTTSSSDWNCNGKASMHNKWANILTYSHWSQQFPRLQMLECCCPTSITCSGQWRMSPLSELLEPSSLLSRCVQSGAPSLTLSAVSLHVCLGITSSFY